MAWSYNPAQLGTSTAAERINSVRLLLGDTDTADQQVQNEEITFGLSQTGDSQGKKAGGGFGVEAGGIEISVVDSVRDDTNRVPPSFRRDRFKNPPSYSGNDYASDFD